MKWLMPDEVKKTSIKQLKELLDKIPERAIESRKEYSAVQLMDTIRRVCMTDWNCDSDPDLIDNLRAVGKRIGYMKYEFSKTECTEITQAAFNFILKEYGRDEEFRMRARKNIEYIFAILDDDSRTLLTRKPKAADATAPQVKGKKKPL